MTAAFQGFQPNAAQIGSGVTGGGPTNYSITCNAGSYAITGSSASLSRGRPLTASAGSYAITGSSANLSRGRPITASPGSYAITGSTASLSRGRPLTANAGSYAITGSNATLVRGRALTANAGSYSITGSSADITYTPSSVNYSITCNAGSYAITGSSAVITYAAPVPAEERPQGGAVSRSKGARKRVVVEVDGKEYIVPIEGLQAFLDEIKNQTKLVEQSPTKRKKRKANAPSPAVTHQPVVKIISAPQEEIELIQKHIDRTNEIMRQVWQAAMQRYMEDIEEEEWLLMLL